jgi:hypothetical protein
MANQFPAAAGYGQIPNGYFVPEIWSGNMLKNYYEQAIASDICNSDYEGEIKNYGDKVIIRRDPEVEIRQYYKGLNLETQTVEDEGVEFVIQRGVYFNFPVDDIDRRQSDVPWVQKVTNNASVKTKNYIDQQMFAAVYSDVASGNQWLTNTTIYDSATYTALDFLVDLGVAMDNKFVPDDGNRWVIVPNWLKGQIKKNPNFLDASKMGDGKSMLRTGFIGTIDRMKVYGSTNLHLASTYHYALAGHPDAITFATQITKTEKLRNPRTFGDIIRGLQVYDWKVVQPSLLFYATVKKG